MNWKLYYDDECNLCYRSKLTVEHWAEKRHLALIVKPLQSEEAKQKGYQGTLVLEADRVYYAEEAWLKMLTIAPWYLRWLAPLGSFPPLRWVVRKIYRLVDRYRFKWFGKRQCSLQ
jgi:predicted DCC family thiol-disulfide oxidoreductase YuxK